MAKTVRNILISLFGAFAFLFAGFFFVGCGADYSNISISSNVDKVELKVGEKADITLTIDNFQNGMSNKIQIEQRSQTNIVKTEINYQPNNQIFVTVEGLNGGNGQLVIRTVEGAKECVVDVFVTQYSKSMSFDNSTQYVSNETAFKPTTSFLKFDSNTTEKGTSFYLVKSEEFVHNYETLKFLDTFNPNEGRAVFSNRAGMSTPATIQRFDEINLLSEGTNNFLSVKLNGEEKEKIDITSPYIYKSKFMVLAVYDYSYNNTEYREVVNCVLPVYILPDLKVTMTGSYFNIQKDVVLEALPFAEIPETIKIVPNNPDMIDYLIKVEMAGVSADTAVKTAKLQELNDTIVDFDIFQQGESSSEDSDNLVFYWKISQNSNKRTSTRVGLDIFYELAEEIEDDSVHFKQYFDIDIEVAPTEIRVNGSSKNPYVEVYNTYSSPEFGFVDLAVDVFSDYGSEPNYTGMYFVFPNPIDITYEADTVVSGDKTHLYKDWTQPFRIRSIQYATPQEVVVEIHLLSDILQGGQQEIVQYVTCKIIEGASDLYVRPEYSGSAITIDYDSRNISFNNIIYAKNEFKSIRIVHVQGTDDTVAFDINSRPYIYNSLEGNYYLNLSLSPKAIGSGMYDIYLDNGIQLFGGITINCIKTLTEKTTSIQMTNMGNGAVTEAMYSKSSPDKAFNDVLSIDILNASTKDNIQFGNSASFSIISNADKIDYYLDTSAYLTVSNSDDATYTATTRERNGNTVMTITLTGFKVENFRRVDESITIKVYISSYSLINEYYLMNGGNYAFTSTVYYGSRNISDEDSSVTLSPVAQNDLSNNFYMYYFDEQSIIDIFDRASLITGTDNTYSYIIPVNSNLIKSKLVRERYDRKFIYFNALNDERTPITTTLNMIVTRNDGVPFRKEIRLDISSGLMFYVENFNFNVTNENGQVIASYSVEFNDMKFLINTYGEFDFSTFKFNYEGGNSKTLILNSNLRQRNSTKRYDATIISEEYIGVQNISLASGITNIDFTNDDLKTTIGLFTSPLNATNNRIRVEYVPTVVNNFSRSMLRWTIDESQRQNGIYTIELSCEDFYNRYADSIVSIEENLSGKFYVYPAEWGDSYTSLVGSQKPICIDVHYRNGSRTNPYILSTAEDVLKINRNETTLRSHYEIRGTIDMSAVQATAGNPILPIGILKNADGDLVLRGFSGSIVGTTSQARISNINITDNIFNATIGNTKYLGLFAKINRLSNNSGVLSTIENVSFTGRLRNIHLPETATAYTGLVSAINEAHLTNLGVRMFASSISGGKTGNVYFGAIAGVNYGEIRQDYTVYEGNSYHYLKYNSTILEDENGLYVLDSNSLKVRVDSEGYAVDAYGRRIKVVAEGSTEILPSQQDFEGQSPKNLAYFDDELTIDTEMNVYAGGVVGASNGDIVKVDATILQLYGYSEYTAFTKIQVTGQSTSKVYVGGIAGVVTYSGAILPSQSQFSQSGVSKTTINLNNLLVGGEIYALKAYNHSESGVGGIVGFVDTLNFGEINITDNTSRIFLRGNNHVGAISGWETYDVGRSFNVSYGIGNKVQAVDDGRGVYSSAMIIRQYLDEFEDFMGIPAETPYSKLDASRTDFVAVGNVAVTGRNYSGMKFEVVSYLSRTRVETSGNIPTDNASTSNFYGDLLIVRTSQGTLNTELVHSFEFEHREVDLQFGNDSKYKMKTDAVAEGVDVFFMYYFDVDGYVSGNTDSVARDDIENLNYISSNSIFYPFKSESGQNSTDLTITTSTSSILTVDVNANITVKGVGLATLTLSSILNTIKSKTIYVLVVNYFDKDVKTSVYYTGNNLDSINIPNGSVLPLRGESNAKLYLVPTYYLQGAEASDGKTFSISNDGILNYNNTNYILSKNTDLTTDAEPSEENSFSGVQVDKQTITYYKKTKPSNGAVDSYVLVPVLKIMAGGIEFYYELDGIIDLDVEYREVASSIHTKSVGRRMQTNENFTETVYVESTNPKEVLFYQIYREIDGKRELVQDKIPTLEQLPSIIADGVASEGQILWDNFINEINTEHLFELQFERRTDAVNVFDFTCSINYSSQAFKDRYKKNIFGDYFIYFYSSELESDDFSALWTFKITLDEAELKYVGINNYSNMKDISSADNVVVPSQTGLLEISLDPIEAVFDTFSIANSQLNYQTGATEVSLTFAYERSTQTGVDYVSVPNFGIQKDGVYTFSYEDMIRFYNSVDVAYRGKIYISYFMPALNVADDIPVGFDVVVKHGNNGNKEIRKSIELNTKLGSYARLRFTAKQSVDDVYYVARGLEYGLRLEVFGFDEEQITISSSNNQIAEVRTEANGNRYLWITPEPITYQDDVGYKVTITTDASKVVDNSIVTAHDELTIYVMEFVMNYNYAEGVNEDIVKGMVDGVISTAIGNPYTLEFTIRSYLEYNPNDTNINSAVESFVSEMTSKIQWTVYYQNQATSLQLGKEPFRTEYYLINGLTVTPLRTYSPVANLYHFSANAYYRMNRGMYTYSATATNSNRIYTEFTFDVHEQSTEDSPLPIESYEEFLEMEEGQWYILLKDIELPGSELALEKGVEEFKPITTNIAGFDGNSYRLIMGGTYNFADLDNIGVFENIEDGAVIKNVTIQLASSTTFNVNTQTFNVGLLASTNAGIITNALVETVGNSILTVSYVGNESTTSSYVAGLVANNTGFITNSRSKTNIYANVNLSGFVGVNSGLIASSYYMEGRLENGTFGRNEYTAGFVINNSGEIYTSFVSGKTDKSESYYSGNDYYIHSSNSVSGFAYQSSGVIQDCYTNINLKQNGAYVAGFVMSNSGEIERCISWSVLESGKDDGYGFAMENAIISVDSNGNQTVEGGEISECFFLQDSSRDINDSIGQLKGDGDLNTHITSLNVEGFKNLDNFKNFVVEDGRRTDTIWFFNSDADSTVEFNGREFNRDRLELVAPNVIAFSQRALDGVQQVVDPTTGAEYVVYNYVFTDNCDALGSSLYNPILVESAKNFEAYISQESNNSGFNYSYYRLISDIDYSDFVGHSNLYTTKFMGYIEGNYMTIDGISLLSDSKMTYAGMFAEIGSSSNLNAIGVVMNMNIAPVEVNFANTDVVGTLAGKLERGKVLNVNVSSKTNNVITVQGNHITGGLIGLATGDFDMKQVSSKLSARSRYRASESENNFVSSVSVYTGYSFAGSLVGVMSGNGTFSCAVTDTALTVAGGKAGLMFGFIDSRVSVRNLTVNVDEGMSVNGYQFAGLVVGESRGTVYDVDIVGTTATNNNFDFAVSGTKAIGGFAGIISGGTVSDIEMTQNIQTSTPTSQTGVEYIGGLAGKITSSARIEDITISSTIVGINYVGGVAGIIETGRNVTYFKNIHVEGSYNVYGMKMAEAGIGGLAGALGEGALVSMNASDSTSTSYKSTFDISVSFDIKVYGQGAFIYLGGLIGNNVLSQNGHSIENTDVVLKGTSSIVNVSQATYETHIYTKEKESDESAEQKEYEIVNEYASTSAPTLNFGSQLYLTSSSSVTYACDLNLTYNNASNSRLTLNSYGVAVAVPEE